MVSWCVKPILLWFLAGIGVYGVDLATVIVMGFVLPMMIIMRASFVHQCSTLFMQFLFFLIVQHSK